MSDLIPSVDVRTGSHRADPGFCVGGGANSARGLATAQNPQQAKSPGLSGN